MCKIAWLDRPNALIQVEDKNNGLIITCLVEPGTNRVALDSGTNYTTQAMYMIFLPGPFVETNLKSLVIFSSGEKRDVIVEVIVMETQI